MPDTRVTIKGADGSSKYVEITHSDGSRDVYKAVDVPDLLNIGGPNPVATDKVAHYNPSGSGWDKRSDDDRHGSKSK